MELIIFGIMDIWNIYSARFYIFTAKYLWFIKSVRIINS